MDRTRVRWTRVAVLAAALVGTLTLAGRASGSDPVPAMSGHRYVVQPGDTLWGIARDLVGPEEDPRPVIERIRAANRVGTAPLEVGRALVLP